MGVCVRAKEEECDLLAALLLLLLCTFHCCHVASGPDRRAPRAAIIPCMHAPCTHLVSAYTHTLCARQARPEDPERAACFAWSYRLIQSLNLGV